MLRLSIRELRLLTELARRLDRIVSRDELYLLVWGRTMRSGDRSVDVYIRKLRVKLNVALPEWSFIHTHFGLGYRLSAEPREAVLAPGPALSSPTMATEISQPVNKWPPPGLNTEPSRGSHLIKENTEP
jgi:DNA-binding winged helix-turn-helix (wHTH) protein